MPSARRCLCQAFRRAIAKPVVRQSIARALLNKNDPGGIHPVGTASDAEAISSRMSGRIMAVSGFSQTAGPGAASPDAMQRFSPAPLARLIPEAEIAGLIVFSERVHIDPPGPEAITLAALPAFVARQRDEFPSRATSRAWQGLCARRPDLCGLTAGADEYTLSTGSRLVGER